MSTTNFIEHITLAGERWDLLAWRYYRNATLYSPIIMANPMVPIESVFEAGIRIMIPVLPSNQVVTTNLPPWKRTAPITPAATAT